MNSVFIGWLPVALQVGLPDLANKNTGHPVKFGFLINDEYDFSMSIS